jgi:pentatricopeptide repeat protein
MKPTVAIAAALIAIGTPAFAAGNQDDTKPKCKAGQVYDGRMKMCVKAEAGVVDDKSLAAYAYALAKDGRYEEALATLDLMQDGGTAEALNYRGYATRKLGRVEEGIAFYQKAVALDPDYTLVREYLGEAYVTQGKLDLAKNELAEIEKRCGTTCEPYEDLAEAIEAAEG